MDLLSKSWVNPSWVAAISIFAAALVGSLHCVGMCGGLQAAITHGKKSSLYVLQLGRLIGYIFLGALLFTVGVKVQSSSYLFLQQTMTVLYGLFFVAFGWSLLRNKKLKMSWISRRVQKPLVYLSQKRRFLPDRVYFFIAGFFTFLLPCGWLYAFALLAAGSPSLWWAVGIMSIFALGTAPALMTSQLIWRRFEKNTLVYRLAGVALLVLGVMSLQQRLHMSYQSNAQVNTHTADSQTVDPQAKDQLSTGGMSCH